MSRRPSLRTNVTTLGRKIERLLTETPIDIAELRITVVQLQDKSPRLFSVDEEIQKKLEEEYADDPPELEQRMSDEMNGAEVYRDNVSRWLTMGQAAIQEAVSAQTTGDSSTTTTGGNNTPTQGTSQVVLQQAATSSSFRLPEFKLPRFNGQDVLRFPSYLDQFRSLVHQNPSLTDVQRFCLLKESLSGTPLSLVDGLMVTSENYAKALDLLEESYNDANLLLGIFVSRLHAQPAVKEAKSPLLQALISQFEQSYHEIRNLIRRLQQESGTPQLQDGSMPIVEYFLTPHLLSKLPEEVQLSWYNRSSEPQTRFSFNGLLAFLKENVRSRQACKLLTGNSQPLSHGANREPNRSWHLNAAKGRPHSVTAALLADQERKCPKCQQEHRLFACPSFEKMDIQSKWDFIKRMKRCFNCLTSQHSVTDCPSKYTCRYCHKRHHSQLCKNKPTSSLNATASTYVPRSQAPPRGGPSTQDRSGNSASSTTGLFSLQSQASPQQKQIVPRTEEAVLTQTEGKSILQLVQLKVANPSNGRQSTVYALFDSGASQTWIKQDLAAELGLFIQKETQFKVQSFGAQTQIMNSYNVEFNLESLDGTSGLVPCTAYTTKSITGALDQYKPNQIPAHLLELDLSNTPAFKKDSVSPSLLIGAQHYWEYLTGEIIKGRPTAVKTIFGWCLSGPVTNVMLTTTKLTEAFISAHVEKLWDLCSLGITEKPHELRELVTPILRDNRYEVTLPFKGNRRPGSNYENALQRSKAQERKLDKEKLEQYDHYFETALLEGIITRLESADTSQGYYLPFHGIWKNGKLRLVFDGSSADPRTKLSINDTLHAGENALNQLYDVLIRFRQFQYPIVGDIRKAFHQISIAPADRVWLKFVWREQTYAFTRAPFGITSSPHLLQVCLHHCFKSLADQRLGDTLQRSNYVDDFPASFVTEGERNQFRQDAAAALNNVSMTLTEEVKSDKVLGVIWQRSTDELVLNLTNIQLPRKFTKRELLRCLASIFDPLGILGPIVVRLKLLFQFTWTKAIKWDDQLPPDIKESWEKWIKETQALSIRIPRWIGITKEPWVLVCFSDASLTALGVALYCVTEGRQSHLIASKARLSPLKPNQLTVPRAELVALLLGARMIDRLVKEMEPPARTFLYTDSETCLNWVNSPPSRSETFIFNRVKEIREKAANHNVQLRHVRSHLNPADAPTKGMTASTLMSSTLWLHGPEFLLSPLSEWPSNLTVIPTESCLSVNATSIPPLFDIEKFSSLKSVINATAWLRRFSEFICHRSQTRTGKLTASEQQKALSFWIRHEQKKYYEDEFRRLKAGDRILASSSLVKLRPVWDSERCMIVLQGRTGRTPLILLPPKSYLTFLIIKDRHMINLHQGAFSTLCDLRRDYWIPHGTSKVKSVIFDCRTCRRFRTRLFEPKEAALPNFRVYATPAFTHVAVDHLGPLILASGQKVWTLVFSCGVTRAIHLELCQDLTAHETSLRIRAFLATRVPPNTVIYVYSDNATCFRKAATLRYPHHQLRWRFSIPAWPSSMGLIERLVGMTKRVLRIAFRSTSLSKDELAVVLYEIASCLNLRPLTPLSTDARDDTPLTPSSFIHGVPPPPTLLDPQVAPSVSLQRRYLMRCRLSEEVWRRWFQQYLPLLRSWRQKTRPDDPIIKVGDLVLVETPTSRGLWPIGKITGLIAGPDGVVRAAHLLLRGHATRRALKHLAPLESSPEETIPEPSQPTLQSPKRAGPERTSAPTPDQTSTSPTWTRSGRVRRK